MKRIASLLATLCLFQSSHAATAVPDAISYQGRALTATGALMGATTPVNRIVIFRIWDHPSNSLTANLIYSEQQVVTIAEGEFSVLVGTGAATANTPLGYSETSKGPDALPAVKISDAFGGVNRYLGVTIDDGTTAVDNEISPRQQIVSGAFALRSKFAESIGSATDLTLTPLSGTASNYGLGWYGTGRLFNSVAVDGPVLYGNAGGALGSNVGGTQKLALAWNAAGQVGIGATSSYDTNNKLTLQGDDSVTPARQLVIRGNTDTTKRLNIGFDTTANKASLQSYTAASTTSSLLLNPSGGNVGVNNVAPSVALDVTGAIKASTTIAASTSITAGTSISTGSNVGIGMTASGIPLNFASSLGDKIALFASSGNTYGLGIQGSLLQIHTDASSGDIAFGYGSSAAMTETMRIKGNGYVGIGTSTPSVALDVTGAIKASGDLTATDISVRQVNSSSRVMTNSLEFWGNGGPGGALWQKSATTYPTNTSAANGEMVLMGNPKLHLATATGGSAVMTLSGANVGIGTTTPTQAKLVVSGGVVQSNLFGPYISTVGYGTAVTHGAHTMSIYGTGGIWTGDFFIASSDVRIKNIVGKSDPIADLKTLLGIEITDYKYRDTVAKGNSTQKKVIAQQVEAVYPQAVSQRTDVVPDIYQKATAKDGWIKLATDLKKGERVKLISKNEEGVHEVLEVAAGKFRTAFTGTAEEVFVYGREVNDFRTVDYDAISMLNVSATQELKREKDAEIQTLRDENAALRRELATKDASLETRLMALERRMSGDGATETVSLKTAQAVK